MDSFALNYDHNALYESGACSYRAPPTSPYPDSPRPQMPAAPPPPQYFSDASVDSVAIAGPDSATLAPLLSQYDGFASSMCSLGDVDGDFITDIAVGAET